MIDQGHDFAALGHDQRGVPLVDEEPRMGAGGCRVAFIHPKAAAGVLFELKEEPKESGAVR